MAAVEIHVEVFWVVMQDTNVSEDHAHSIFRLKWCFGL
jgi:hypothetical protein